MKKSAAKKSQPRVEPKGDVVDIPLKEIWLDGKNARDPGWEKKVTSLQRDIKKRGLLQPIEVARMAGPKKEPYRLVFGHRRIVACRALKMQTIPAKVKGRLSEKEIYERRQAENAKRRNLAPMEIARDLHTGMKVHKMTTKELGALYPNEKGEPSSAGWVSQHIQLLKLPKKVQGAVEDGSITPTHAREIARVTDTKTQENLLSKAKNMPVTDFKNHVAGLDKDKKKDSNRGRKARTDKPKQPTIGEKAGVRNEKEVMKALGEIDTRLKNARDKENKLQEQYFKGMVRGITWTRKMGGVKKLY